MARECRPPAAPDGLQEARPCITTSNKPKATFLTLPQELRDHIYSFLPLVHDSPISLTSYKCHNCVTKKSYCTITQVCRILREDVTKAFWSNNQFMYDATGRYSNLAPLQSRKYLGLITDVFVLLKVRVKARATYYTRIRLLKTGGTWKVTLEEIEFKGGYAGSEKNNKMEFSAILEPDMTRAECILNTYGRLTPILLTLIERVGNCAFSA